MEAIPRDSKVWSFRHSYVLLSTLAPTAALPALGTEMRIATVSRFGDCYQVIWKFWA